MAGTHFSSSLIRQMCMVNVRYHSVLNVALLGFSANERAVRVAFSAVLGDNHAENRRLTSQCPRFVLGPYARIESRQSQVRGLPDRSRLQERKSMAKVYVEARPKDRPEGSRIDDYVVEDHADHVLATFKTPREAIDWAKSKGHAPLVARVRHPKTPDHWRAA
jgi:hypothetical protein